MDRIELPPCPDCGQAVTDLRIREEMRLRVRRVDSSYLGISAPTNTRFDVSATLDPCGHEVVYYEIMPIDGESRITRLRMQSNREWVLNLMPPTEITIATMCPGCGENRTVRPDGTFEPHHTAHNGVDGPLCSGISQPVIVGADCVCEQQEQPHRHLTPHRGVMSHAQWQQCEFPGCPCSSPPKRLQIGT